MKVRFLEPKTSSIRFLDPLAEARPQACSKLNLKLDLEYEIRIKQDFAAGAELKSYREGGEAHTGHDAPEATTGSQRR